MRTDVAEKLAAVDLFGGLSSKQLKRLAGAGKVVDHAAGRAVATEGEGSLALHLVLDGEFDVSIQGSHVRTLKEGDYFGEISMIDGKPRSAAVTARTPASCLAIPHAAFAKVVESEPEVARVLLVSLAGRLREAESRT
jgi:CRP/FNR family cyclic AMP-dependent transcriptional regulator